MKGLNSPVQRNIQTRETSHATVTEQCQDSWPGFPHRGSGRNGMYGDRQCHRKPSTFGVSTANRPAASVIYVTRGARAISELISILSSLGNMELVTLGWQHLSVLIKSLGLFQSQILSTGISLFKKKKYITNFKTNNLFMASFFQ